MNTTSDVVKHEGGCHCKSVRFEVYAPKVVEAWDCNCSICSMKRNTHFIVPNENFHLKPESECFLSTYTFGTRTAKHTFCKVCGICSFYYPRSNPDGVAITVHCIDDNTLEKIIVKHFDGQNWEHFIQNL